MDGLKARLISLKNRVQGHFAQKMQECPTRVVHYDKALHHSPPENENHKVINSVFLYTCFKLRRLMCRQRQLPPCLPTSPPPSLRRWLLFPSTLLPTFTPPSEYLSVTQRSPSLNSWGSWLSVVSALSKEERGMCC